MKTLDQLNQDLEQLTPGSEEFWELYNLILELQNND